MSFVTRAGWLDGLKNNLTIASIKETFYRYQPILIELGLSLGVGFLVGFLVKKWGRFIALVVGVLVVLGIVQQLDIISLTIRWETIYQFFGIKPVTTIDSRLIAYYGEWIQTHSIHTLLFLLGFVMGLRLA